MPFALFQMYQFKGVLEIMISASANWCMKRRITGRLGRWQTGGDVYTESGRRLFT